MLLQGAIENLRADLSQEKFVFEDEQRHAPKTGFDLGLIGFHHGVARSCSGDGAAANATRRKTAKIAGKKET